MQTTQNKMVRYIIGLQLRSHIGQNELDQVKYRKVDHIIYHLCLNHMYKVKQGSSPCNLKDMFKDVAVVLNFMSQWYTTLMFLVLKVLRQIASSI